MYEQAYIYGFMSKCAEAGLSKEQVSGILSQLGTQFGANPIEDSSETDYKSGIGDAVRNIWKSPEVMARKQRRFEEKFKKTHGLGKIWEQMKHPVRSARAEGTAGALGMSGAALAGYILASLATRGKAKALAKLPTTAGGAVQAAGTGGNQ